MKKLIAITFILILTLSLSGCGTPAEHYAKAVENFNEAVGITCNYESKISFTDESGSYGASATGRMFINHGETTTASMSGTGVITPATGAQASMKITAYYDGEKYYAGTFDTGICYDATWEEAMAQIGQYSFAAGLTETDFEGILSEETEDGEIITYVVPSKNASAFQGIKRLWERTSGKGDASITSIQGKLTLDDDQNPIIQELVVSGNISDGTNTLIVSQTIKTTIGFSEEAVAVESPSLGSFSEISK